MFVSEQERERRYAEVRKMMAREQLDMLLVMGNTQSTGNPFYSTGTFRYLTDFFIFSLYGMLLFFREEEPIMLVPMELQETVGRRYSWVRDVRISLDYAVSVGQILDEKGMNRCRLGLLSMDSIPASAYLSLRKRLPEVEFVDATSALLSIRFVKSEEERRFLRKAAEINDEAYQEVLKKIRPGLTEFEVAGILEGAHRSHGADRTFNLVFSGRFPVTKESAPFQGLPWCPGKKVIEEGDCVHLEMTTVYGGYWNQLVRMICIGKENPEVLKFHQATRAVIEAGLGRLKPGTRTPDFVEAMRETAEKLLFKLITPMGHFVGLDLVEGRVQGNSQVVLNPGIAMILHPRLDDSKGSKMILWGETYFMTEKGPIRLNRTDDTLHTV